MRILASDASATGWGGSCVDTTGDATAACGASNAEERLTSSTMREGRGLMATMAANKTRLQRAHAHFFTDDAALPAVVERGSRVPCPQALPERVEELCEAWDRTLKVHWWSRRMNGEADALSRCSEAWGMEDCSLKQEWHVKVCKWGNMRPTMDAFANAQNAKVVRCGSMTRDDKCQRVCSAANHPADEEMHAFPPRICAKPFLENLAVRLHQGHKQRVLLVVPSQMDNWTRKQLENRQGCEAGARKAQDAKVGSGTGVNRQPKMGEERQSCIRCVHPGGGI